METELSSIDQGSLDVLNEQVEKLKELFPEVVVEGKVDFERLKATTGKIVDDGSERYSLRWAGERNAIRKL
jgi:adenine-specific DNA-methyltransferase